LEAQPEWRLPGASFTLSKRVAKLFVQVFLMWYAASVHAEIMQRSPNVPIFSLAKYAPKSTALFGEPLMRIKAANSREDYPMCLSRLGRKR
jgi:hypothetical protein